MFRNVSKVVLRGRYNTLATFSEDALHFSWQAQHFGDHHHHFAWQAHRFRRVMLRVFLRIALSVIAASSGDRCKFRRRRGILRDVLKIDGSLARNIANFTVHEKTRGKTSIRKLQSVKKLEEVSHEMLVLMLQHVSSRVSGFPPVGGDMRRCPHI